ncbi:hypothetical protein ACFLWL_02220 [Chloroflexota bacterium]
MGRLTRWGAGCFIFGWGGNIFVEVFPMTGWEIPQELARIIVFICIGLMGIGVILIFTSFKKVKNKYDENLAVTNEMMRVYQGSALQLDKVAASEINSERLEKKIIPDILSQIDTYFVEAVEQQDLDAKTLVDMSPKMFIWYDWFKLIFMVVTYSGNYLRRIFKNTHINYIIQFTSKLNVTLKEYGLGTIPVMENNNDYLTTYKKLIRLESGLPIYIITNIHRNILLSASINSLRIIRSDSSFWDDMEAKKLKMRMALILAKIRNVFPELMVILDGVVTGLRSEIKEDIQKYIES